MSLSTEELNKYYAKGQKYARHGAPCEHAFIQQPPRKQWECYIGHAEYQESWAPHFMHFLIGELYAQPEA